MYFDKRKGLPNENNQILVTQKSCTLALFCAIVFDAIVLVVSISISPNTQT